MENEDDKAIMRMIGRLAECLVMIAPEMHSPYAMMENKKKETCFFHPGGSSWSQDEKSATRMFHPNHPGHFAP